MTSNWIKEWMRYRVDRTLWIAFLTRTPFMEYQTLVGRGNSKVIDNLPYSVKDWKPQFFFAKLVGLRVVELEKPLLAVLTQKGQEPAFKAIMSFFKEGSMKWFTMKEKFFSWCRTMDLHNLSRPTFVPSLRHIVEGLMKVKPLKDEAAPVRRQQSLKSVRGGKEGDTKETPPSIREETGPAAMESAKKKRR
ncbi:hypothetical protein ACLOJK_031411 [Asimina triloba]